MRRSLAPSQKSKPRPSIGSSSGTPGLARGGHCKNSSGGDDDVVIETMPLFGFLSIPDSIRTSFRVPSGCVITEA